MARYQSSNSSYRSFRCFAAARVDFSGSERSSIHQVWRSPYSLPREEMNCHIPRALARETARGRKALSAWARKTRSCGTPSSLRMPSIHQSASHHRPTSPDALQPDAHRVSAASLLEVVECGKNPAVKLDGQVVL